MLFKKKNDDVQNVEEKENLIQKTKRKYDRFQLTLAFIGAVYFVASTFLSLGKNYTESPFFPYIVASVALYMAVFIGFLIAHRKNAKNLKADTKNFKSYLKLFKIVENLFFISSSLLIFLNGLTVDANFFITAVSGALLVLKLLLTVFKLLRWFKKKKKQKIKAEKQRQKELKKLEKQKQKQIQN